MPCLDNSGKAIPAANAQICMGFGGKWVHDDIPNSQAQFEEEQQNAKGYQRTNVDTAKQWGETAGDFLSDNPEWIPIPAALGIGLLSKLGNIGHKIIRKVGNKFYQRYNTLTGKPTFKMVNGKPVQSGPGNVKNTFNSLSAGIDATLAAGGSAYLIDKYGPGSSDESFTDKLGITTTDEQQAAGNTTSVQTTAGQQDSTTLTDNTSDSLTLPWQLEEAKAVEKFPSLNKPFTLPTIPAVEKAKDEKRDPTFLENIQNKDWWFESMSDIPGDNRLNRIARGIAFISTPQSKRGDNPTDIRREQLMDRATLKASREKSYLDAQTELSRIAGVTTNKRMAAILKIADISPQHLAKSIEEFIPSELNTSWFKMKDAEKQSLAMAIAIRASQAMQLAATDEPPRQMPYPTAMKLAAQQILDERK
jgi:hypothetical protein